MVKAKNRNILVHSHACTVFVVKTMSANQLSIGSEAPNCAIHIHKNSKHFIS